MIISPKRSRIAKEKSPAEECQDRRVEETLSGRRVAQLRRWSTETPAAERREDTGGEREEEEEEREEWHISVCQIFRFLIVIRKNVNIIYIYIYFNLTLLILLF